MEKKDLNGAIACLEAYVKKDTKNGPANNNLLLLYHDTQQTDKARNHIKEMQKNGLLVPKEMLQLFGM